MPSLYSVGDDVGTRGTARGCGAYVWLSFLVEDDRGRGLGWVVKAEVPRVDDDDDGDGGDAEGAGLIAPAIPRPFAGSEYAAMRGPS